MEKAEILDGSYLLKTDRNDLTQLPHLFYKNCKNYHVFFKK
jgi:hypothetical protein